MYIRLRSQSKSPANPGLCRKPGGAPLSDTVSPEQIRRLPAVPGVYLMKDAKGAISYVG